VRQLAAAFLRRELASGSTSNKFEAQKRQQAAALQREGGGRGVAKIDQQWWITARQGGSWRAANLVNPFIFREVKAVGVWK
jgi:hypothetical protein